MINGFAVNPAKILQKKTLNNYTTIIVSRADNCAKHWRNLPISNPKPDFLNINACTKFGWNPLTFTRNRPETKIWACLG